MDRRIALYEDIEEESEDEVSAEEIEATNPKMHVSVSTDNERTARQYVGELFGRIAETHY